ncbi:hypothetical protein K7X08_036905 [Anisodus acutangulus]|uniref:Uncharacterized protein n=1 Tax=Anisodus acutangulus TaxID=402998 RepID=A0A9Q1L9G6_9SOLA|nr:hypothetical protein K7X08_036905 [Anisodus acutangulus]
MPMDVSQIFSVKCGVRGDTGPACNAVGMIHRKILASPKLAKNETTRFSSPLAFFLLYKIKDIQIPFAF